ncbi:hypothetical protein [Mixta gaviniae]|nr:hypothetical protein [Mixta gaviniae]
MGESIRVRWLKRVLGIMAVMAIVLTLVDCQMMKVANQRAGFKESDWWLYYAYVDKDIKDAPRIAKDYYFRFRMMDGPSPEMSTVVYRDATETAALESYLKRLGYQYVSADEWGSRWEREGRSNPKFYLWQSKANRIVRLTKYIF